MGGAVGSREGAEHEVAAEGQVGRTNDLTPGPQRLGVFGGGVVLVATGIALTAELGVAPYDVLTGGLADRLGLAFGGAAVLLAAAFVAAGMALRGRPGLGTALTIVAVGPVVELARWALPEHVEPLAVRQRMPTARTPTAGPDRARRRAGHWFGCGGAATFSSWYSSSTLTFHTSWWAPKMFSTDSMAVSIEWSWLL